MITEHTFCVLAEGSSLRHNWLVKAVYAGEGRWVVHHFGIGWLDADFNVSQSPTYFDEATAVRLAEEAAPVVRCWTVKGVLTAYEAVEAGLR